MANHPVSHVQLRQLRQLAAVAEDGSIRAAAQRLSIGQPALSRSLRALEDQLQVKLLERSPRGVVLTKYGEILCNYARIIDANLRFAAEEIEEVQGGRGGSIRMGIGPFEGFTIAHRAISNMFQRRPDLEVALVEGDFDALASRLLAGEIDLILGPTPVDQVEQSLSGEILAYSKPLLVVRSSHPLAEKTGVDLRSLAATDWILSSEGTNARNRVRNVFRRHGLEPPISRVSVNPSMTALELLKKMDLVALLPRQLVEGDRQAGLISVLQLIDEEFSFPVRLTTRKFGQLSPAGRELIGEIRKVCDKIGDEL